MTIPKKAEQHKTWIDPGTLDLDTEPQGYLHDSQQAIYATVSTKQTPDMRTKICAADFK